jgi:cytochrome c oxidase subunit IV
MANHGSHHVIPISTYRNILFILIALTVATVAFAPPVSGLDIGFFSVILAFLIATIKAALVLAVFMGLKYDNKLNLAIFLTSIFLLFTLLFFCAGDIWTRIFETSTL